MAKRRKRSIRAAVVNEAELVPQKDRGRATFGDKRAALVLGDNSGAAVRLTVTAIEAADVVEFGRCVYLVIEGDFHADLKAVLARAAALGDRELCIFLNEPAKANLLEQLESHRTIVALHEAMLKQREGA